MHCIFIVLHSISSCFLLLFGQISTLSIPRFGFGLAVATDEAILAGGRTTKDKTISSVIRIKLDSWDQVALPPMNVGRAYFGLIPMPQYNPND